ncbi:MAG: DUF58 domain-containing protein [Myxococcaceae bacterium]
MNPLWRRFRAWWNWRAPRTLSFTLAGRTYLVVTVGVGLGALNTGNNLLYLVLGFMLSLIVASGVLSERALRGLKVQRLLPEAAFAGEPFALRYSLWRKAGRSFAIAVRELDGKLRGSAFAPVIDAGDTVTVRASCVADKRGPLALEAVELSTAYPFGLFVKTRRVEIEEQLLIFPRRGFVCADPPAAGTNQLGEFGNPKRRDGGGDLWGLRELNPGEDARRVHWVKSAQVGRLLRVERESEERAKYQLWVDSKLSGDPLEHKCEETAAMAHRLIGQGHEVGLTAGEHKVRPGAGAAQELRLLKALAWVGHENAGDSGAPSSGLRPPSPVGEGS